MTGDANYWLTRLFFTRALALVYFIAFLCALNQFRPLLGEHGLLPATAWIRQVPSRVTPSLFYLIPKDWAFTAASWIGIAISVFAMAGLTDRYTTWLAALTWAILWVLYLSFVNVGQTFYGFGWESILLEAGFFAMFLGAGTVAPPAFALWVFRWLEFRLMFGAGLIKLRGDPCWRDLTCLNFHYETQPMPNPLSWYFHWAPPWTHTTGVAFNHFSELIVPFGYFAPQPVATIAAALTMIFQGLIMASGNLSWLNFLTIILAIPLIDGRYLAWIPIRIPELHALHPIHRYVIAAMAALVVVLSIQPVVNMLSPRQAMNAGYNPFHLLGTYGAFGSITRTRYEVIVEGTSDSSITASSAWREYEFKGKPGDTSRRPPQIAPYHLRLDWLMWFAAMSRYERQPWFINFVAKLLHGDKATLSLLRSNPFPDHPPQYIRAELYEYHFTTAAERRATGKWWKREYAGEWFPAVSLNDAEFRSILQRRGWL